MSLSGAVGGTRQGEKTNIKNVETSHCGVSTHFNRKLSDYFLEALIAACAAASLATGTRNGEHET